MKKLLVGLIGAGVASTLLINTSFAQSVTEEVYTLPNDFNPAILNHDPVKNDSGIGILAEAKYAGAGTYFEPSSTSTTKDVDFEMDVTNEGDITTNVTRTVQIEKSGQVSVGGETEFNIMMQKVKATATFTGGIKSVKTTSITWAVPKRSVYTIRAGSMVVKTSGYIEKANSGGVVTSRHFNTATGATKDFSDSILVKKL